MKELSEEKWGENRLYTARAKQKRTPDAQCAGKQENTKINA
jgi:hypothetical protein